MLSVEVEAARSAGRHVSSICSLAPIGEEAPDRIIAPGDGDQAQLTPQWRGVFTVVEALDHARQNIMTGLFGVLRNEHQV